MNFGATRLLWAAALLPVLIGCGGNRHHIHGPGSKGALLEKVKAPKAAMVDEAGKLQVGPAELPAGTLFKVPADGADIRKELGIEPQAEKKTWTTEEVAAMTYGEKPD